MLPPLKFYRSATHSPCNLRTYSKTLLVKFGCQRRAEIGVVQGKALARVELLKRFVRLPDDCPAAGARSSPYAYHAYHAQPMANMNAVKHAKYCSPAAGS